MPKQKQDGQLGETRELPSGVKLVRTIEGHEGIIFSIAFDPAGQTLASGSDDGKVKLWDVTSGELLRTLDGHEGAIYSVAFDPMGRTLASGGDDSSVRLWDTASGKLLRTLDALKEYFTEAIYSTGAVYSVAFDPAGRTLASAGSNIVRLWDTISGKLLNTLKDETSYTVESLAFDPTGRTLASGCTASVNSVKLWKVASGKLLSTLEGHNRDVYGVAFDPTGQMLASGSSDKTVKLCDTASGKLLRTLEGHTGSVGTVGFYPGGHIMASKSHDGTIRLWSCETWDAVAVIPEKISGVWRITDFAFHPTLPLLASIGSKPDATEHERSRLIHLWELDLDVLLGKAPEAKSAVQAVHHTTAKMVLVGDSGVGKTGLGWRLAHGEFNRCSGKV